MTSAFHEAFSIFVFLVTIVGTYGLSTKGIRLRIPYLSWTFSLGSETVPWLSVLVLLAFRALHFKELGRALIGEQGLRPYAIAIQLVSGKSRWPATVCLPTPTRSVLRSLSASRHPPARPYQIAPYRPSPHPPQLLTSR